MRKIIGLLCAVVLYSCGEDSINDPGIVDTKTNILLIIADDLGKDAINGYDEGTVKASTPHLDALRESGLTFDNMWVYPTCTPTRSSIITGKYGYRTNVKMPGDKLDASEEVLHSYIKNGTGNSYATGLVGKWHLAGDETDANPEDFGIDYYAGLIRGSVSSYYQWQLSEDGQGSMNTEYITTVFTDLAIDWIEAQDKPWFLWLAYNAPHTPFHVPPAEMHNQGDLPEYVEGMDATPYFMAAIEAMDFQIGRLMDSMTEEERANTCIIFIGDNGSPGQVAQDPYSRSKSKGSLYQGGINVPMFASGQAVNRQGREDALISSTDLFTTIASMTGIEVEEINDSQNFSSLFENQSNHRSYQYSELDNGSDALWTLSNGAFKLIVNANGDEEMYNLETDPYEENDVLEGTLSPAAQMAKEDLEAELSRIRN